MLFYMRNWCKDKYVRKYKYKYVRKVVAWRGSLGVSNLLRLSF